MPEYEVLRPIRLKADEEPQTEGTLSMSEEEAQRFLDRGSLRELPERASKPKGRPRKQASFEGESEDSNEE